MSHPFSTKGTIGRFGFLCYLLLYIFSPILGLFTWLTMELLDSPLGSPATGYIWGERSAAFVRDYLSWITDGWGPGILILGSICLGTTSLTARTSNAHAQSE